jgi:hypothetical protein
MTVANITVTDTDSFGVAADIVTSKEDYGAYLCRMADELAAESGFSIDDFDGDDPHDSSPITPAALPGSPCRECNATGTRRIWTGGRLADWIEIQCGAFDGAGVHLAPTPTFRCATCQDTGRVVKPSAFFAGKTIEGFCPDCTPHFDFASGRFLNCGTGTDSGEATPPTVPAEVPFDRAADCRRIASFGGAATLTTPGVAHFRAIGAAGARVTIDRHGDDTFAALAA